MAEVNAADGAPPPSGGPKEEGESAKNLEGGSYDVIRKRLLDQATELGARCDKLNEKRKGTFGGSDLTLLATERVRTEHNCVPRDIRPVQGNLLFGYNVFIGLKTETVIGDVFSVHQFVPKADGTFDLSPIELPADHWLCDPNFVKEFTELYRYNRETRLLQLRRTDTRLLAVFQIGQGIRDIKVFRWRIEKGGKVVYMDARGDEDNVVPKQHDFEWKQTTREDQVSGRHAHYSILNEVFVETTGGDLTIKVENNTAEGKGIYSEPVDDRNQTLDDSDISYARVGPLILLRIKPYREQSYRYFVFNTRLSTVVRVDSVGQACLELPEDQGVIFPGGYVLRTGEFKVLEGEAKNLQFKRAIKSPNGEDILYVYADVADGHYTLLPYNLIRKDVQTPIQCHGYSIFDDGKMVVFKSLSEEPTKVHPMQVWQSPFMTQEHAASAPTDGSYLAKVGNAELVRGISEVLTLRTLARSESPTRKTFEDIIATSKRIADSFYWVTHEETFDIGAVSAEMRKTAELIIDEFEKVLAMKRRAAESLAEASRTQESLLSGLRPQDMKSVEDFMKSLTQLRTQRGHLITLRELRYMDLPRVDTLEKEVIAHFDEVSKGCVEFLLSPTALKPLIDRLSELVGKIEKSQKAAELLPIVKDLDQVNEGLAILSEVVAGLKVDDPTQRTRILEGISEVYAQLNRGRATLIGRRKELASSEGRAEFSAQFKLFGQSVQSSLSLCDTPERCDSELSKLLVQLEELEGKFSEFDEFVGQLAEKREEVQDAISSKRQTLLDERQRRAQNLYTAAERIVQGIGRRARTITAPDELNAYFASDAMVLKLKDLAKQLFALGDSVKADEIESKLKSARQDALRALRDRQDLYEDGDNVIKLGKHRFNVNTQTVELTLVPREDPATGAPELYLHLTGTDYYEQIEDPQLEAARDLWPQQLVSENGDVYRGEFLAASILWAAESGQKGLSIDKLQQASSSPGGLLEIIRAYTADKHDEGYERGVHDSDAALILEKVISLRTTAGLLRFGARARALAGLWWAGVEEEPRAIIARRALSLGRLQAQLGVADGQIALAAELAGQIADVASALGADDADVRIASRYLVEQLAVERVRFLTSGSAAALKDALYAELDRRGSRRDFDEDLRALEKHPSARLALARHWVEALASKNDDLKAHRHAIEEAAVLIATDRKIEREVSSGAVEATVAGVLGSHRRIHERQLHLRLDEFLGRLDHFVHVVAPRFRKYRDVRHDIVQRERKRLRLDEFTPRIMSSFVRNRLIDEVYLHLVGDNLAKQMGAAGEGKRTDLMGLLLLISPPGYGKTTLMEYVANKLGLVFMKINGPALGHEVKSLDPNDAPNATARQEVDKVNLALEMGNNVMIYVDDIQHTNSEFLQKFISLCDAQRKIEGVWKGKSRTYDLRGKKVCVCMAGNPYTETGEKFRIPDMLANRADTYNLGDILDGKGELFALSYIENALTSNRALAPLAGRDPKDIRAFVRMAKGEAIPVSELSYAYSAAEVGEIVAVLQRLFKIQEVLLKVNLQYIASASQDDQYRNEPPFKLQGSYRNMNKVAEKVVSAHTPDEIEALIDDHYAGESQTLTTGAEQNVLKLNEMRGRLKPEQLERWEEIKTGFVRVRSSGGRADDPVARVTGTIGSVAEQLDGIRKALGVVASDAKSRAEMELADPTRQALVSLLANIDKSIVTLSNPKLEVNVDRDPAIAELLAHQLSVVEDTLLPVVRAVAESSSAAQSQTLSLLQETVAAAQRSTSAQTSDIAQIQAMLQQAVEAQAEVATQIQAAAAQQQHAVASQQQAVAAQHAALREAQQTVTQHQQTLVEAQRDREAFAQLQAQAQQVAHAQVHAAQVQQQALQQAQAQHAALAHLTAQAQQTATAQAQAAQAQQQAAQSMAQGAQAAHAQAQAANAQVQVVSQAAKALQTAQAEHAAQIAAQASAGDGAGQHVAGAPPTFVQRSGASPEENAAIARAQQATQASAAPALAAVERVEGKLNDLSQIIRGLQDKLGQGVAAAQVGPTRYDVALGLETPSYFYTTAGNGASVLKDGGIFVATYRKPPPRGSKVTLRLNLPGGVEFDAIGLVEWTREARMAGAVPGFGARLVEVPATAMNVVDQFARARPPVVHGRT